MLVVSLAMAQCETPVPLSQIEADVAAAEAAPTMDSVLGIQREVACAAEPLPQDLQARVDAICRPVIGSPATGGLVGVGTRPPPVPASDDPVVAFGQLVILGAACCGGCGSGSAVRRCAGSRRPETL